jgi:hypothetical protein
MVWRFSVASTLASVARSCSYSLVRAALSTIPSTSPGFTVSPARTL